MQIWFDDYTVLPLQFLQLLGIAVVYDNQPLVPCPL
jgi:hypothetical protein